MSPLTYQEQFLVDTFKDARMIEKEFGLSHRATLTQAAHESGWGKFAPGNMFFGVKDTDGVNGNEQLITTTEYHSRADVKYPVIISVTPTTKDGRKMFRYKIKDYFRKYATPADCFRDHALFLSPKQNPRYAAAWQVRHEPLEFFGKIAKAGYATDPNYYTLLSQILKSVDLRLNSLSDRKYITYT